MAPLAILNKVKKALPLVFLILLAFPLRFHDLGYSDYIGDERKAIIELAPDQTLWDFFLTRRKGPMQFLVSEIPHQITGDFRNEHAQRIPFAVISVLAVAMFYLMVKKLSQDETAAFIATALYLVNGFIVGFGRIAQYQNLNLLFSFLAVYFYSDLLFKNRKLIRSTLFGTLFFSLSLLSHWDVIFIIPVVAYIFIRFLINKSFEGGYKARILIYNLILGCLLLLPFLYPYLMGFTGNSGNQEYFGRRVSVGSHDPYMYLELIRLYNPFLTFELVSMLAVLGLLRFKKSLPYILWFVFGFLIFQLFVRKPGTHIYNFVLPALMLSGLSLSWIINFIPRSLKYIVILVFLAVYSFLYYQAYYIFIDHSKEYPWEQKTYFEKFERNNLLLKSLIPDLTTPVYTIEQKLPLFGFPHYRHWNEINDYINDQNAELGEDFGYITNEDKTISEWYIDAKYRADNGFYIIGVREPVNFVKDTNFPQYSGKTEIKRFYNGDQWVVKIYRIEK